MADSWGRYLRVTLFGESHGPAIGVVLDGLPAGFQPDLADVARQMARRAPGGSPLSTSRRECDSFRILSGLYEGRLTGTALTAIIENADQHSGDYAAHMQVPRPGHADFTGHVRYGGFEDPRGGGHFSGRMTAPILFAGALCAQWLAQSGVAIAAKIVQIGRVRGDGLNAAMQEEILSAKRDLDAVGGVISCTVTGLAQGLGAPFFDSVESVVSSLLFAIPAVKGVSFGDGFALCAMRASEANDQMRVENGALVHLSNHNGGVLGGITNGEPLVFQVAIKPTPSIARPQKSVSLEQMRDAQIEVRGRHDPSIVPRALPVVEAAAALALGELWKERLSCRT
ncbi:MAG: chorismate synthase [Clostridia bacterium]